ncbi:MAG: DsbA family protein [Candidatus Paceibacterota bacterium]
MKSNTTNYYIIAAAIIVVGGLIGSAVLFSNGNQAAVSSNNDNQMQDSAHASARDESLGQPIPDWFRMPAAADDHIRGAADAPVMIVEYSDFECPFCGRLHPTLTRIIEETDDVAWTYRHFPLSSHSNAFSAAVASECIANLSGNDSFWSFTDASFANQRGIGDSFFASQAGEAGISADVFAACMDDAAVAQTVQDDLDEVASLGGRGTPFVVVLTAEGNIIPFSGALPYEQVTAVVDYARSN